MADDPKVRPFRASDASAAAGVLRRCFERFNYEDFEAGGSEAYLEQFGSSKGILSRWADGGFTCVATHGEEVVGIGQIAPAVDPAPAFRICMLYVEPTAHRSGLGRALLDVLVAEFVRRDEVPVARLNSSHNAVPFYERYGFERDGPVVRHGGAIVQPMSLRLRTGSPIV